MKFVFTVLISLVGATSFAQNLPSANDTDFASVVTDCGDCLKMDRATSQMTKKDPCARAAIAAALGTEIQKAMDGGYDVPDQFVIKKLAFGVDGATGFSMLMDSRTSVKCAGKVSRNGGSCTATLNELCK